MLAKSFQGSFRSRTILATTPKFATVPAAPASWRCKVLQCLVLVGSQQMISGLGGKHPSCVLSLVRIRTGSELYVKKCFGSIPGQTPLQPGRKSLKHKNPSERPGMGQEDGILIKMSQVSVVAGKLSLPSVCVFAGLHQLPGGVLLIFNN